MALGDVTSIVEQAATVPTEDIARHEAFWSTIRAKFKLKPHYIKLENGYYSMQPQ